MSSLSETFVTKSYVKGARKMDKGKRPSRSSSKLKPAILKLKKVSSRGTGAHKVTKYQNESGSVTRTTISRPKAGTTTYYKTTPKKLPSPSKSGMKKMPVRRPKMGR